MKEKTQPSEAAKRRIEAIVRAMDVAAWQGEQAKQLSSMAGLAFLHSHLSHQQDELTTRNCQGCCLRGLHAGASGAPNVAGWERMYVQTLRRMPLALLEAAFTKHLGTTYASALARDVLTWGIPQDGPANGARKS